MIYTYTQAKARLRQVFPSDMIIDYVENDLGLPSEMIPTWEAHESIVCLAESLDYIIDYIYQLLARKIDSILFIHESELRTDRITWDDGIFYLNGDRLEPMELIEYLNTNWTCEIEVEL